MITNRTAQPVSLFEEVSTAHPRWADQRVVQVICEKVLAEAQESPPVDVELVASMCGIATVEYRPFGPAGMLLCRDGTWVASIRSSDGLERQRFTVLHEAGHTLQPGFKRSREYHRCQGPRTREEQLSDLAAAELLLPRKFFERDLRTAGQDLRGIEQLASAYVASIQATARRVVDVAAVPLGMLVFHLSHKPQERGGEHLVEPKVRLQYTHSRKYLPFPLRHKSAPYGSPIDRAWRYELVDEASDIDDYFAHSVGPVWLSAQRYGEKVIALVRPMNARLN